MVWTHKPSNRHPSGSSSRTTATVAGQSWNLSVAPNEHALPVITDVAQSPTSDPAFDLNDFIQQAVANDLGVTNNHHLSVIFASSEIRSGGSGVVLEDFYIDLS